jgi:hypothetical protein
LAATSTVLTAPIPIGTKLSLAPGLTADYKQASQTELPDFGRAFAHASAGATPSERTALNALHEQLDWIVQRAATNAFKLPLRYGAIFAILVLPLLGLRLSRRTRTLHVQRVNWIASLLLAKLEHHVLQAGY